MIRARRTSCCSRRRSRCTHYLDSRYNALAPDGSFTQLDGSFIRAEQSKNYLDYRRHRASLGISWDFRDRLRLAANVEAWVRHFDVYEARDVDNFWTGQLRLDTEIEASMEAAVRVHISLVGAHVSRNSNMTREISQQRPRGPPDPMLHGFIRVGGRRGRVRTRSRARGQTHRKGGALAGAAGGRQLAAQQLAEAVGDREADAGALEFAGRRVVGLDERAEQGP